jgi:1-deoxy-D-xylulose-5-phosphate reductoisomerase
LKYITILGSTGSIGTQTLEVIAANKNQFAVFGLVANTSAELLIEQARAFRPEYVVIADEARYEQVREGLSGLDIEIHTGTEAVLGLAGSEGADVVVAALVGFAGLAPTLAAIRAGRRVALANKETLVVAGELVMAEAARYGAEILPVDSEHSAIYQCLVGEETSGIEQLILTASGGPFRGKSRAELELIKPEQALKHPNWTMGAKVTIDSSTLMNKGLEVIEARWLFGIEAARIRVLVHPQSIVHSMVQFTDGSIKAQLGPPDMRLPIHYALAYPARMTTPFPRTSLGQLASLTFEEPDMTTFGCLRLAFEAIAAGGFAPCVLNAANEVAVAAFLKGEIPYLGIEAMVERALERVPRSPTAGSASLAEYESVDTLIRAVCKEQL